jgi:hypothetical protein
VLVGSLALAALLVVAPASAQSPTELEARALFEQGLAAAEAGAHADALTHFERSFTLVPRASTAFNVAVQQARLGRPRAALFALDALEGLDPSPDDRREADALRSRLRASLATLVLRVAPASAELLVDGEPVVGEGSERTLALDPGAHRIELRAPGFVPHRRTLRVLAGASAEERVELAPVAPSRTTIETGAIETGAIETSEVPAAALEARARRTRHRRAAIVTSVLVAVGAAVAITLWALRPEGVPADDWPDDRVVQGEI